MKHTGIPGVSIPLFVSLVFPSPALPGSGSMGMISARYYKAPLNCGKGMALLTLNQSQALRIYRAKDIKNVLI